MATMTTIPAGTRCGMSLCDAVRLKPGLCWSRRLLLLHRPSCAQHDIDNPYTQ